MTQATSDTTVRDLDDAQLKCSAFQHAFDEVDVVPSELRPSWFVGRGEVVALECTSCGCRRIEVWDSTGEIAWRDYFHDSAWVHFTRDERPSKAECRKEYARRRALSRKREAAHDASYR